MTLLKPTWMQPTSGDPEIDYPGNELRQIVDALTGGQGAFGGHALKIVQRGAGANMSIDANSGQVAVIGDDTTAQGTYLATNTADGYNVSTWSTGGAITAPASGTRTHRVVAQIRDKRANGAWTTYDWDVLVLQDTGTGTPAEPASALTLATISIASGQASIVTANITDLRPFLKQVGYQQSWQNMSLLNGWVNRGTGYMRAAYRVRYLGAGVLDVDLIGEIVSGNTADATVIYNLPAGYLPNVHQHIPVVAIGRTANNDPPYMFCPSTGDLRIYNCAGANTVIFNGSIRLDAPGG